MPTTPHTLAPLNSPGSASCIRSLGDQPTPEKDQFFARVAFKEALLDVSKVRLEQTLYAEHPDEKQWLERLRGEKTLHTAESR